MQKLLAIICILLGIYYRQFNVLKLVQYGVFGCFAGLAVKNKNKERGLIIASTLLYSRFVWFMMKHDAQSNTDIYFWSTVMDTCHD